MNNTIFYHTSPPLNRVSILTNGLVPMIGVSYEAHYEEHKVLTPFVFLSKTVFDSTWDDDVYEIIFDSLSICEFEPQPDPDKNMADIGCVVTTKIIPPNIIKLIKEGSGESTF